MLLARRDELLRPFQALEAVRDARITELRVGDVLHRGLRGVPTLVTNVSTVDPEHGLYFRGRKIAELADESVLDLVWLGITGAAPSRDEALQLRSSLAQGAEIPDQVLELLDGCSDIEPIHLCRALDIDAEQYRRILAVYGIVHIDQGKGNPSSHIAHIVSTTGADPYRCAASSLLALSCPSHAFAGIGALRMMDELYALTPDLDREEIRSYLVQRLRCGEPIYGIGQAVMKNVDTRYSTLRQAAGSLLADDPYLALSDAIIATAAQAFRDIGKHTIVVNPNVNMISSLILCRAIGVDRSMLPLLFGVSRMLGNLCQYVESLLRPRRVCRPLSYTPDELLSAARTAATPAHRLAATQVPAETSLAMLLPEHRAVGIG